MTVPTPGGPPVGTDCDLLGDVPTPAGTTAGPWRTDDGRLVRTLSDGRVQHGAGTIVGECRHCTVPVASDGDECAFCRTYVPPETVGQQLDVAVNRIELLRIDLNKVFNELPADAPLFGCADLAIGICHLKRAAEKIDRAAAQFEAAAAEVLR